MLALLNNSTLNRAMIQPNLSSAILLFYGQFIYVWLTKIYIYNVHVDLVDNLFKVRGNSEKVPNRTLNILEMFDE